MNTDQRVFNGTYRFSALQERFRQIEDTALHHVSNSNFNSKHLPLWYLICILPRFKIRFETKIDAFEGVNDLLLLFLCYTHRCKSNYPKLAKTLNSPITVTPRHFLSIMACSPTPTSTIFSTSTCASPSLTDM
jgi:hypothetical protein